MVKPCKTMAKVMEKAAFRRLLLDSERFEAADEQLPVGSRLAGHTALHTAAQKGHTEAALVLLEHPKFTKAR